MAQDSRYLDLVEGTQSVFVTGIRHKKADNDSRAAVTLRLASHPTSVSHTAPYTNITLSIPKSEDDAGTKIMFEQRMKSILYPLAGKGQDEKVGLNTLYQDIKATLSVSDVEAEILVKQRDGNSVDPNTGAPRKFSDVISLTPTTVLEKAPYVSDVDFDEAIQD
jgi:hypothetical protein